MDVGFGNVTTSCETPSAYCKARLWQFGESTINSCVGRFSRYAHEGITEVKRSESTSTGSFMHLEIGACIIQFSPNRVLSPLRKVESNSAYRPQCKLRVGCRENSGREERQSGFLPRIELFVTYSWSTSSTRSRTNHRRKLETGIETAQDRQGLCTMQHQRTLKNNICNLSR